MSRSTIYADKRLTVIAGNDHVLGNFFQIFDKKVETPEGEGLVFDWSERFGIETNFTGLSKKLEPLSIVYQYVGEYAEDKTNLN